MLGSISKRSVKGALQDGKPLASVNTLLLHRRPTMPRNANLCLTTTTHGMVNNKVVPNIYTSKTWHPLLSLKLLPLSQRGKFT
jgi:hypothetical protein